jgi:hypothetical protein
VPGLWFFHELVGLAVRSRTGEDLGSVVEIYRAGGAEVFVVRGPRGELDVPGVRGIVAELAPERGEMIVDLDSLALDARPVEDDDYVRPRDRRPKKQPKPKGPSQPKGPTTPIRSRSQAKAPGASRTAGVAAPEPGSPALAPKPAPPALAPDDGASTVPPASPGPQLASPAAPAPDAGASTG